jgi:hypothetical protein
MIGLICASTSTWALNALGDPWWAPWWRWCADAVAAVEIVIALQTASTPANVSSLGLLVHRMLSPSCRFSLLIGRRCAV